jgi:hypothetical protein
MNFILKFYLFFPEESKLPGAAQAARLQLLQPAINPIFQRKNVRGVVRKKFVKMF